MHNHLLLLRTQLAYTQQQLADLIGVTRITISRWERGEIVPHPFHIDRLCQVFHCQERDLGMSSRPSLMLPSLPPTAQDADALSAIYDTAIPYASETPLVGREEDLARIKTQLCHSESSVVLTALNGIPGVGKTALAITLANDPDIRRYFSDGILWAGLGPTPDCAGLLHHWGMLLGLSETRLASLSLSEKSDVLCAAVGLRSFLIIIDDVWQLEHAHVLRIGGSNCAYLITTRFPAIAAHLTIDGAMIIQELNEEHSIHLLSLLAPAILHQDRERIRQVVRAVGGLPLALTLLGNYLRKQAYSGPIRRINAALDRLNDAEVRLQINEPPVHKAHPSLPGDATISLNSILAVTDRLLSSEARAALYALSLFPPKPQSFSEEAALALADCTTETLDELSDTGLLEHQDVDRYRLHQIIADYARVHLDEQVHHTVMQRLLVYMQQYIERHAQAYELLEQEIRLILYTLDLALTHEPLQSHLVPLICAAAPFLLMRGYYQETQRFLDHALTLVTISHDLKGRANVLLFLGDISRKRGQLLVAKEHYEQAKELARHIHDPSLTGWLTHHIGWVLLKLGIHAEAEGLLREGLTFAQTTNQPDLECEMDRLLGSYYAELADYEQSEAYTRKALAIARHLGDRQQILHQLSNLSVSLGLQGSPETASYLQEALQMARAIKSDELCCLLLINLGDWYTLSGSHEYSRAEAFLCEALAIAQRLGHTEWMSGARLTMSALLRLQERFDEAERYTQEALALAHTIDHPRVMCIALEEVGNLALAGGDFQKALETFQQMVLLSPAGDVEMYAMSRYGLARAYEQLEQWDQAAVFGQQALVMVQQKKMFRHTERIEAWYNHFIACHTSVS